MNTLKAIAERRSIRKFKSRPVSRELTEKILAAGIQAPSGKNLQPWKFYVIQENSRAEMIRLMHEGIASRKAEGM